MSSIYKELPQLNFVDAGVAIAACIRGNRTPMLIGAPGVGKTALQAVIADAFDLPLVTAILSNCFGRETKFITSSGVKSFEDFSPGAEVTVLTHTGGWRRAVVNVFGAQQLFKIRFARGGNSQTVRATRNHRWILADGAQTTDLSVGNKLYKPPQTIRDWAFDDAPAAQQQAWLEGFVYGDGSAGHGGYGAQIRLCGDKARFASRFEHLGFSATYPVSSNGDPNFYLKGVRKGLPNIDVVGRDYLVAFVRGYLDADGSRNTRHPEMSEVNPFQGIQVTGAEAVEFVRKVFPMVGAYIVNEDDRTDQPTNFGDRSATTIYFSLVLGFSSSPVAPYVVREITEDVTEEVWCLTVEGDHSFVMPNGIVTGNCDPTDVAGLPMLNPKSGKVELHAFPELRHAQEEGVLLFLDEFTAIRRSVEAPALRLILERVAGGAPLHKNTRIVGACNPPEHAPGGIELSAAMLNRIIWLRYAPRYEEISNYFVARAKGTTPANLAALSKAIKQLMEVDYAQAFATEALDFAATMAVQPDLVQLEPPEAAINAGSAWGSPRAWEAGIAAYAALGRSAASGKSDAIGYAILAGAVGPHCAVSYLGIRDLRTELPTVADIVAQPDKAKVPTRKDLGIAAIGVIARVAQEDAGAAWIYMQRMQMLEVAAAGYRLVEKYASNLSKSKFGKEGVKAYSELSRRIGNSMG